MNVKDVRNVLFKKYVAEGIGTFVLVFCGCGSAIIGNHTGQLGYGGIAFAFGLCIVAMAYTFGNISGCHLNPAVTLAMMIIRSINVRTGLIYIVAQCIGSIVGAGVLYGIASGMPGYDINIHGLGANGYAKYSPNGYSVGACFFAEWILTLIFILVIVGSTSEKSGHAEQAVSGLVIGLTLCLIHLVGIPITGVSVNPARSLGPALLHGGVPLEQLWMFWTAPFISSFTAAWLWKFFFDESWQQRHGLTEVNRGVLNLQTLKSGKAESENTQSFSHFHDVNAPSTDVGDIHNNAAV